MSESATLPVWKKILKGHLGVRPGERVLVIVDRHEDYDGPEAEVFVAPPTAGHGCEPLRETWCAVFGYTAFAALEMTGLADRLLEKRLEGDDLEAVEHWAGTAALLAPDVIVCLAGYSTSHTLFRRLLNRGGTRYASLPRFERDLLREGGPLDIEPLELIEKTRALRDRLEGAGQIRIRTPRGTDLAFDVAGRSFQTDDGELRGPGAFGNLPAGEVYIAPNEEKAHGLLVLEDGTSITVEKGRAIRVEGNGAVADLFVAHPEYFAVAELGFGTNERAERTDHVLEAEKIAGTVHVAFGDNSTFGGALRLPYHEDHVLFAPTITVDGRKLEGYAG
jgi:leucyl aminopeptidase (aminopeptidase T)